MVEAIQLVLARRHYRAGAYTIGYHSCDDSTAQARWVQQAVRCYTNAQAYARNPDVIGIIVFGSSALLGRRSPWRTRPRTGLWR